MKCFSSIEIAMIMGFLHRNRNTKTEVGTWNWNNSVIGLTMFLLEGIRTLVLWIRKIVECFKC